MTIPSIAHDLLAEIEAGNISGSEWAIRPIVNRIRQIEEVQRWIPVSDRLPEARDGSTETESVLSYNEDGGVCEAFYCIEDEEWYGPDGDPIDNYGLDLVTHWMPLPEPPQ